MKPFVSITVVAALMLLVPIVGAQAPMDPVRGPGGPAYLAGRPCGSGGVRALRGTYAYTGTAWQDLSVLNPALPKGYAPVTIIGAFKLDGEGNLTGWSWVNAGGVSMSAEFVNSKFGAPKADCSIPITLSMKMPEFGEGIAGPYPYVGVVAGDGAALEIRFMMLGTGPGSHVELDHAKRISMSF